MVPAGSRKVSPASRYSGYRPPDFRFPYRTITLYGAAFQPASGHSHRWIMSVLQPQQSRNPAGLGFSPFARRYLGNNYCSLFLPVLRCFSSRSSLLIKGIQTCWMGCPIRRPMDHRLFAPTHGLSQLTTSFIASECPGIHTYTLPYFLFL